MKKCKCICLLPHYYLIVNYSYYYREVDFTKFNKVYIVYNIFDTDKNYLYTIPEYQFILSFKTHIQLRKEKIDKLLSAI